MKPRLLVFFSASILIASTASANIELRTREASILPGTATDVIVIVTNDTGASLLLRPEVALQVQSPTKESFVAERRSMGGPVPFRRIPFEFWADEGGPISLAPGKSFSFEIPFFSPNSFFRDSRFLSVGPYKLRARMLTAANEEISSPEVLLSIVTPTGADAEVWKRMQGICGVDGCWWGAWEAEIGEEVLTRFPESRYAEYATGYRFTRGPQFSSRREISLRGPYREHALLYEATEGLGSELIHAIDGSRQGDASRIASEKRRALRDFSERAESLFVRASATSALADVPSAAEIVELIRSNHPNLQEPSKIKPFVACVSNSGNAWIAWFGYENATGDDYWIGTTTGNNKFEPKPHFRGQPEQFLKDGQDRAFSVTFDGEPITWFIKGEKATASKSSPRCAE